MYDFFLFQGQTTFDLCEPDILPVLEELKKKQATVSISIANFCTQTESENIEILEICELNGIRIIYSYYCIAFITLLAMYHTILVLHLLQLNAERKQMNDIALSRPGQIKRRSVLLTYIL